MKHAALFGCVLLAACGQGMAPGANVDAGPIPPDAFPAYSPTSYSGTLVIAQPLVLSGNDTRTFENLDIIVSAPITVMDNASLVIHNSRMTWDQDYHQQYWTTIQDHGQLTVDGLEARTNHGYWYNWNFLGNSDISIKNLSRDILWTAAVDSSNVVIDNSEIGLTVYGWSDAAGNKVSATNSYVYYEFIPQPGTYDFSVPQAGPVDYWAASFMGDVSLTTSTVYEIDFDVQNATNITIRDSKNVSIGWDLTYNDNSEYSTSGIQRRHYVDETRTVGDSSLRIINTDVNAFWPYTEGNFTWHISDSDMADVRSFGTSTSTFDNCNFFSISGYDSANITVTNSFIENNAMASNNSVVNLDNITTDASQFFYTLLDQGTMFRDGTAITASTTTPAN